MKETNFPYKNSHFEMHFILLKTKLVFEKDMAIKQRFRYNGLCNLEQTVRLLECH